MGRSAKRYISVITVLMVMLIPMSSAYAAINSIFSHVSHSQNQIEVAVDYHNSHDSLEIIIDGSVSFVDELDVHDLLFSDTSHDNQGSGGTSVSISTQINPDSAEWSHVFQDSDEKYELTSVLQPTEIRPPIHS